MVNTEMMIFVLFLNFLQEIPKKSVSILLLQLNIIKVFNVAPTIDIIIINLLR